MKIGVFTLTLMLLAAATTMAQTISSVYTPLAPRQCKPIKGPDPQRRVSADAAATKPCLKKKEQ